MTKVALSGAAGNIGRLLRVDLPRHGIDLRSAGGRKPLEPLCAGEDVMHGDLREPDVVDRLLQGVDTLVHLAGTSVERPLQEIIENNLVALHQVYEGARRNKVRRIVFASSNHAFGMHSVEDKLELDAPFRPDGTTTRCNWSCDASPRQASATSRSGAEAGASANGHTTFVLPP